MTTETREIGFWGDMLVRWPSDVVAKMGLRAEDAAYLTEVGLPVGVHWNLIVEPPVAGAEPARVDGMPVVAVDDPVPVCVDPAADGVVVALQDKDERRFVNSSLRQFGTSLMIYGEYRRQMEDLDEKTDARRIADLIEDIAERLRATDTQAIGNGDTFWGGVVWQMRNGFL